MKIWDYLNLHISMLETNVMIDLYKTHEDPLELSEKVFLTNKNLEK